MSDWLHNLPLVWMAIFVFGCTFLVTAAICWIVTLLAVGERVPSFKAVSPGILPPLGIIFGLLPRRRSGATINSKFNVGPQGPALRAVVILASRFPADGETRLRTLIREYIGETTAKDWPMMANRTANLRVIPQKLAEALQLALTLEPNNEGQRDRTTRNYDLT